MVHVARWVLRRESSKNDEIAQLKHEVKCCRDGIRYDVQVLSENDMEISRLRDALSAVVKSAGGYRDHLAQSVVQIALDALSRSGK